MGDTFAISALRRKRAHLAGEIEKAQRAITSQRDTLATLDAVIRLFEPEGNPDLIPSIRPVSRRCLYFRRGEQTRLCVSALRDADKPIATRAVAEYALSAKGLTLEPILMVKVIERVRNTLHRLVGKGIVRKIVDWPDTWWELAI